MRRKSAAPTRTVTEVGRGDYVKIGSTWKRIASNSAQGQTRPRHWLVRTEDGQTYGRGEIMLYAKAEDIER